MRTTDLLARKIEGVAALFRPRPGEYEKLFAGDFLAQIPPAQLTALFASAHAELGRCVSFEPVGPPGPYGGSFELIFESGRRLPLEIAVSPFEPHLITGLLLGSPAARASTLQDVTRELAALPGEVSFLLARLGASGPSRLAAHRPDAPLAVGSAYKLYVLCALISAVKAGGVRWADVVELEEGARSFPSGSLHEWPARSPLTVHTLAALMISQSDNTAADQLARHLGRENVEQALSAAGHSAAASNIPFLTSLEMFKLRGDPERKAADAYLSLDARSRRDFLENVVAGSDRRNVAPPGVGAVRHGGGIEWFASASDLCRAVDWVRRQTEDETARAARDILAINRPHAITGEGWRYVGYKGGSEPGVLNLTFLLQNSEGTWYALSAGWNDSAAELDEGKFLNLIGSALRLAH